MWGVALSENPAAYLLGLFVLAVLVGALIPRPTHNKIVREKDETIHYLRAALDRRDEQTKKLVEASEINTRLLEELKRQANSVTSEARRTST